MENDTFTGEINSLADEAERRKAPQIVDQSLFAVKTWSHTYPGFNSPVGGGGNNEMTIKIVGANGHLPDFTIAFSDISVSDPVNYRYAATTPQSSSIDESTGTITLVYWNRAVTGTGGSAFSVAACDVYVHSRSASNVVFS